MAVPLSPNSIPQMKEPLFTKDYCAIVAANFLLYFGFWLLIPILPMYLSEVYQCSLGTAGILISCYTLSALCMRPFSGYLFDSFSRKPIYITGYALFVAVFFGYITVKAIGLFALLRIVHGIAFGIVTVGGYTIVVDIMPKSKRGEGLGYYGMANNMAMAVGPMTGLLIHNHGVGYTTLFLFGLAFCGLGLIMGSIVKTPAETATKRQPFKLKQMLLRNGIPAGIALLLLSVPYGMTTNYIALYAKSIGLEVNTGIFFTLTATGMAVSRILAGKLVDRGYITEIIQNGFYGVITSFTAIALLAPLKAYSATMSEALFYCIPIVMGIGFGVMFPAYNSVFVNLAPKSQRGTATSTYLTSWDMGLGLGIVLGGSIAQKYSFSTAYLSGALMAVIAAIYFKVKVTPCYHRDKVTE